jgi:hypothetical protein
MFSKLVTNALLISRTWFAKTAKPFLGMILGKLWEGTLWTLSTLTTWLTTVVWPTLWKLARENPSATVFLFSLGILLWLKPFTALWFTILLITVISAIFYCEATDWAIGVLKQLGKGVLGALFTFVGFGLFLFAAGFYVGKYEIIALGTALVVFGLIKSGSKLSEKIPLGK